MHKSRNCRILSFEKLIGPSGGCCTEEEHLAELRKIARFLELEISDEKLLEVFSSVYGTGPTFRRAKTSVWRESFNEKIKDVFKKNVGDLLIELGYEESDEW